MISLMTLNDFVRFLNSNENSWRIQGVVTTRSITSVNVFQLQSQDNTASGDVATPVSADKLDSRLKNKQYDSSELEK